MKMRKTPSRATEAAEGKRTVVVKDMILEALERAGGVQYLTDQANENPRAFLTLLTKVIPLQVRDEDDDDVEETIRWARTPEEATPDPSRR